MLEAVEPFTLHIISMSYLYEVFEHLQLLCIDIWMHIHSVTTTEFFLDSGELAESLGDVGVQPYHFAMFEAVEPFKLHITSMSYLSFGRGAPKSTTQGVILTTLPLATSNCSIPYVLTNTIGESRLFRVE